MAPKKTPEIFRTQAFAKHGNKYEYITEYENAITKIAINCPIKGHGIFWQTPYNHLYGGRKRQGCGCPECAGHVLKSTENFKEEARVKHPNKYNYDKSIYHNSQTPLTITYPKEKHGDFEQRPHDHLAGQGCPECYGNKKKDTEKFREQAKIKHPNKYNYDKSIYENSQTPLIITCPKEGHGDFKQSPNHHLNRGDGCPECAKRTIEEFKILANAKHNNKFEKGYPDKYENGDIKIPIKCPVDDHGVFWQKSSSHLQGHGCPKCVDIGCSKVQIEWLLLIATYLNINIEHDKNGGEHKILNSKYEADGYYEPLNIIYEFHGCYWHGCPDCFPDQNDTNGRDKTYGELYQKTLNKQKYCEDNGYKYICIWGCEFNRLKKDPIAMKEYLVDMRLKINAYYFMTTIAYDNTSPDMKTFLKNSLDLLFYLDINKNASIDELRKYLIDL